MENTTTSTTANLLLLATEKRYFGHYVLLTAPPGWITLAVDHEGNFGEPVVHTTEAEALSWVAGATRTASELADMRADNARRAATEAAAALEAATR